MQINNDMLCPECQRPLIVTPSGYAACLEAHGKLQQIDDRRRRELNAANRMLSLPICTAVAVETIEEFWLVDGIVYERLYKIPENQRGAPGYLIARRLVGKTTYHETWKRTRLRRANDTVQEMYRAQEEKRRQEEVARTAATGAPAKGRRKKAAESPAPAQPRSGGRRRIGASDGAKRSGQAQ